MLVGNNTHYGAVRQSHDRERRATQIQTDGGVGFQPPSGAGGEYPSFVIGFFVPTVVDENGIPIPMDEISFSIDGRNRDASIMLPQSVNPLGDEYEVEIAGKLVWHSNLSPESFGSMKVHLTELGWSDLLEENPSGVKEVSITTTFDALDRRVSKIHFREKGITLRVSARDDSLFSDLGTQDIWEIRLPYVTPNYSKLIWSQMITAASETYDRGVDAADKVTSVNLGRLRRITRILAYAQVAHIDMVTKRDLLWDSMVKGMAAFKEPIEESDPLSNAFETPVSTSFAGPLVASHESAIDKADLNNDGKISTDELNQATSAWARGEYATEELEAIIGAYRSK